MGGIVAPPENMVTPQRAITWIPRRRVARAGRVWHIRVYVFRTLPHHSSGWVCSMSLVCSIFLAMVAGIDGACWPSTPDQTRLAIDRAGRADGPRPSRSLSASRKCWHRTPGLSLWAFDGPSEFDSEESDESWIVHLDAVASVPGSWLRLAWSRSKSTVKSGRASPPSADSYFPLRC